MSTNDVWNECRDSEWTIVVTRHEKPKVFCKLYPHDAEPDSNANNDNNHQDINFILLEKMWLTSPPQSLPKVYFYHIIYINYQELFVATNMMARNCNFIVNLQLFEAKINGFIVNYEDDGRIWLQFETPYCTALQNYILPSRTKIIELLSGKGTFQQFQATLPLDPEVVYMGPHGNCRPNQPYFDYFRAKYILDENVEPGQVSYI